MGRTGRIVFATVAAGVLLGVFAGLSSAARVMSPCTGSMLSGSFRAVPGSAGAGNIVYRLRVVATGPCFVTGVPSLTLLGKTGAKLPTKTSYSGPPGTLSAIVVPLGAGRTASLTARFSPDVPGTGEPAVAGACEPTAYKLRVTPSGGGAAVVPIVPPTPVCEHGSMAVSVLTSR